MRTLVLSQLKKIKPIMAINKPEAVAIKASAMPPVTWLAPFCTSPKTENAPNMPMMVPNNPSNGAKVITVSSTAMPACRCSVSSRAADSTACVISLRGLPRCLITTAARRASVLSPFWISLRTGSVLSKLMCSWKRMTSRASVFGITRLPERERNLYRMAIIPATEVMASGIMNLPPLWRKSHVTWRPSEGMEARWWLTISIMGKS